MSARNFRFRQPVVVVPGNRQEHENELRLMVGRHMGYESGNPSQWVVDAVMEAFQMGAAFVINGQQAAADGFRAAASGETPMAERVEPEPRRLVKSGIALIGRRITPKPDDIEG